jgi:hypothetical protein
MNAACFITPVPERFTQFHAAELPQKDELCGPFWGSLALRAYGFERVGSEIVDQDLIALRAGSLLTPKEITNLLTILPPGASGRADYRLTLPESRDPSRAGTSSVGLARSIEQCAAGQLEVVPIAGPWESERIVEVMALAAKVTRDVVLIANVQTGHFRSSAAAPQELMAMLNGHPTSRQEPDWDVGHFVTLSAAIIGPRGTLVCVCDTYPSLGWKGYHLQPLGALTAAIERTDGKEGGILWITRKATADGVRDELGQAGFHLRHWDNGSADAVLELEAIREEWA